MAYYILSISISSERRVSLSLVSPSHIIKYKHQLDNVILSNATYSFQMGEGTLIYYDFNGIQNELGRFIFSKPIISLEDFDTEFSYQVPIIEYFQQFNLKIKQVCDAICYLVLCLLIRAIIAILDIVSWPAPPHLKWSG